MYKCIIICDIVYSLWRRPNDSVLQIVCSIYILNTIISYTHSLDGSSIKECAFQFIHVYYYNKRYRFFRQNSETTNFCGNSPIHTYIYIPTVSSWTKEGEIVSACERGRESVYSDRENGEYRRALSYTRVCVCERERKPIEYTKALESDFSSVVCGG